MSVFLTLIFVFCVVSRSFATDPATIAAALPDEASECRYLLKLCDEGQPLKVRLVAATEASKQYQAAQEQSPPRTQAQLVEVMGMNQIHIEAMTQAGHEAHVYSENLHNTMTVIRAKHAQMPDCFIQCSMHIPLEQFR